MISLRINFFLIPAALFIFCNSHAAAPGDKLTLKALTIKSSELPREIKLTKDLHCISNQARIFHDMPEQGGLFPALKEKNSQSLRSKKGMPGTVLYFEYETPIDKSLQSFLGSLLWGGDGPSEEHPEEFVVLENFLIILSFEQDNAAARWFKVRMRDKFDVRMTSQQPALNSFFSEVGAALKSGDAKKGLKLLIDNDKKIEDSVFGQYLMGDLARQLGNWEIVEKAYRRAIELDETQDLLPSDMELLNVLDGLGVALIRLDRPEEAIPVMKRSVELAEKTGVERSVALANYNYACTCAKTGLFDASLAALKKSIALDPEYRESAKTDPDFQEAVKRDEFKKLLK